MTAQPDSAGWTLAAYLAFERESDIKHEYFHGEVYPVPRASVEAMAGASEAHVLISGNIHAALHTRLQDRPCRVYQSDLLVKAHEEAHFYPDVTVVCDEPQFTDASRRVLTNPALIVEVLSPSTEDFDRGKKFVAYRRCATLRDYVLVAQDTRRIEHYQRQSDGTWLLRDLTDVTDALSLASLAVTLSLADVYAKVELADDD